MDLQLNQKVAAVAASSQGLGFAIARTLALEGAHVGICSRNEKNIRAAAERIKSETGRDVFAQVADVSEVGASAKFVDAVAAHYGDLHVLVTNAGGPPPGGFDLVGHEELERGFHLTMVSTIEMIKAAVPHMKKNKWGRVVNVLSLTVKQPVTSLLVSNTMRAGLVGYTKSISQELAGDGILINNVAPGYTKTERLTEHAEAIAAQSDKNVAQVFREWQDAIPMKRLGLPDELANVTAFLCSEPASYVTGVTIQVDGGYVKALL